MKRWAREQAQQTEVHALHAGSLGSWVPSLASTWSPEHQALLNVALKQIQTNVDFEEQELRLETMITAFSRSSYHSANIYGGSEDRAQRAEPYI